MSNLMNPEQQRAIEHPGGVLVEAGAGSGKTFVLVEHFVARLRPLIDEADAGRVFLQAKDYHGFSERVKKKLSEMVIMTFTRKAAGELNLRIKDRIRRLEEEELDEVRKGAFNPGFSRWGVVREFLDLLSIGTIHGFCYKILKKGFVLKLDPNFKIVDDAKSKFKIERIFLRWFTENLSRLPGMRKGKNDPLDVILSNPDEMVKSLQNIFTEPMLREMWIRLDVEEFCKGNLSAFFGELLDSLGLTDYWDSRSYLEELDVLEESKKFKKLKWYQFLQELETIKNERLSGPESFARFMEFFNKYQRMPPGPREDFGPVEIKALWERVKGLRGFFKDNEDCFSQYFDNADTKFINWMRTIQEIVHYIEKHYWETPELTFSDLEYFLHEALKDAKVHQKITEHYSYFIVDEFQDVSQIQFSLLKKFINNDFNRVMCVGDIKQAIYGFRGGELGVFLSCQECVNEVIRMKFNYRSRREVIEFNNMFFDHIFRKGENFAEEDRAPIPFYGQNHPFESDQKGEIVKLQVHHPEHFFAQLGEEVSNRKVNEWEAMSILNQIMFLQDKFPGETIAVLYKNLSPSKMLISLLLEENLSFTAQIKIPYKEDPIVGIFKVLIERALDRNRKSSWYDKLYFQKVLVECYLGYLTIDPLENLLDSIKQFFEDIPFWGVVGAFQKFLYSVGISNSNYGNNMVQIEDICSMSMDNLDRIYTHLMKISENKYSIEFEYGACSKDIIIMTAHAAKGLEFPRVILGGIYTNGQERMDFSYLGKLPGSFKWKAEHDQHRPLKSPYYLLEGILEKSKSFSESKRLLYVACTRAKYGLYWVDLSLFDNVFRPPKNSWINGMLSFEMEKGNKSNDGTLLLGTRRVDWFDISRMGRDQAMNDNVDQCPFFHINSMGILGKTSFPGRRMGESASIKGAAVGMTAELSVTRLSLMAECPRKFYLNNICKIDEEDLGLLQEWDILGKSVHLNGAMDGGKESEVERPDIRSNKERGSKLHYLISLWVKEERSFKGHKLTIKDEAALNWVIEDLSGKRAEYRFQSERPLKFKLFGYMITGTPDLVLIPVNGEGESGKWPLILDFKSGQHDPIKEEGYWFQVHAYAYALYSLETIQKDSIVELRLVFLDEQKSMTRKAAFSDIEKYLFHYWQKMAFLDQVNEKSCPSCNYKELCWENPPKLAQV